MIESLPDPNRAAQWCAQQRARNHSLGYVPTMGALHRGHLSLVEQAVRDNDVACASIFVNPLQFNNRDDLQNYPRTMQQDIALLQRSGCHMVYSGTLAQFFPEVAEAHALLTQKDRARARLSAAMRGLEGAFRPRHLQGVWAIVERLFRVVGPCQAYFGEKDFQQTLVVKDLAKRFDGIKIVVGETIREPSGLALSSRNQQMNAAQLRVAAKLYAALRAAKQAWQSGVRNAAEIESVMRACLQDARIEVEYVALRDPTNWSEHTPQCDAQHPLPQARALLAAYIGGVRLLDNISLD